jgi:hypothetical protein
MLTFSVEKSELTETEIDYFENPNNKNFYVSLCKGLIGYYIFFKATTEEVIRDYCLANMGKIWCNIYDQRRINEMINSHKKLIIININDPIILNDCGDYY